MQVYTLPDGSIEAVGSIDHAELAKLRAEAKKASKAAPKAASKGAAKGELDADESDDDEPEPDEPELPLVEPVKSGPPKPPVVK